MLIKLRKSKLLKGVAVFLAVNMVAEIVSPLASYALTSGPAQPEFASFEPVATTNMVNDFTGDFTYNLPVLSIPGANGGGYSMSLSYHSGANPEEESSWVGYGWTLNPGSIVRNKRGFADDANGETVKYWNKVPKNWTVELGAESKAEVFSFDLEKLGISGVANGQVALRYNRYKGFGYSAKLNADFGDAGTLGYSISDGDGSFTSIPNVGSLLGKLPGLDKKVGLKTIFGAASVIQSKAQKAYNYASGMGKYGLVTYSNHVYAGNIIQYEGSSYDFKVSVMPTLIGAQLGPEFELSGNYNFQQNVNAAGNPGVSDDLTAYGYMYSDSAISAETMMDYYVEREKTYNKLDKYLGIPMANVDNFGVTGEGIGGGFRLHKKTVGHFRPNAKTSRMNKYQLGVEVEAGLNIGGGVNLGFGQRTLSVGQWGSPGTFGSEHYFRFNGDQGGSVEYTSTDAKIRADLTKNEWKPGIKSFSPDVSKISRSINTAKEGQSSFIAYSTNKELDDNVTSADLSKTIYYNSYSQNDERRDFIKSGDNSIKDGIGELNIVNAGGTRYNYGLPVYSRNEGNMSYGVQGVEAGDIQHNYLVKKNISDFSKLKVITGEERDNPYATTFLLTEITGSDYIDRKMDGPSEDDFGGWTKFNYRQKHGNTSTTNKNDGDAWYRWRIPYDGLLYNRGSLSDPMDDRGSVSYGEKEIYYLDSIETKTHVAVFNTSDRSDGIEAAANSLAANNFTVTGTKTLEQLDRIDLFVKQDDGSLKLIRKTHFVYDNTLCNGVLNAATGKLTLKKVWFEYEGVINTRISPYEFEYNYPTTVYPTPYGVIDSMGYVGGIPIGENPNYSHHLLDAWGNYQADGANRYSNMTNWLDQTPTISTFDPAAWQLKVIKLPSGGEIHVQYEQDDYQYVQNRFAMAMVSLKESGSDQGNNKFYIDVNTDLGIDDAFPAGAELKALRKRIQSNFVDAGERFYYKFLYNLIGTAEPEINKCNSEYLTGYTYVKRVDIDSGGLYVKLGRKNGATNDRFDMPRKICRDFVEKERMGKLQLGGDCNAEQVGVTTGTKPLEIAESFVGFLASFNPLTAGLLCAEMNYDLSYFRLPMMGTKLGGGIRVKRILMYNQGVEAGANTLYGSEYTYDLDDGTSSGVATNEPPSIREENALVRVLDKEKQSFVDLVIAGRNKDHLEGPLGETLLPGASVGYSRIRVDNIHSGKTNTGYAINEYFTVKDAPQVVYNTGIDPKHDITPIALASISYNVNNFWMTQGYAIEISEMHGKPKRLATFTNSGGKSTSQEFEYYGKKEQIPMMTSIGTIINQNPGKEMEMNLESRVVKDILVEGNLSPDIDLGFFFIPIPFITAGAGFKYAEMEMYQHITSKVIRYPAILKSSTTYADGIYHKTDNLAFDPNTGQAVLTRTTDGYHDFDLQQSASHNGYYHNYAFMAPLEYENMGQKASNEGKVFTSTGGLTIDKNYILPDYFIDFSNSGGLCTEMSAFIEGDLLKINQSTTIEFYHVDKVDGNRLYILPAANYRHSQTNLNNITVKILRSGKTNQLGAGIGGIVTYGVKQDPVVNNSEAGYLSDRQALVTAMNAALPQGTLTTELYGLEITNLYYPNFGSECVTITPGVLDTIINGTDTCYHLEEFKIPELSIDFTGSTKIITWTELDYYDSTICVGGDTTVIKSSISSHFYCTTFYNGEAGSNGVFKLDSTNGEIYYYDANNCLRQPVPCLGSCKENYGNITWAGVLDASANEYASVWPYDTSIFGPEETNQNAFEYGERGKWRASDVYTYSTSTIGGSKGGTNERIYKDADVFDDFSLFNWQAPTASADNWLKLNEVTAYSPNGEPIEEKNILGIYSAAKFGYNNTLPYLVAQNADYGSIQFESFEKLYNSTTFEDGLVIDDFTRESTNAHSGKYSIKLQGGVANYDKIKMKLINLSAQIKSKGLSIKVWVKDPNYTEDVPVKGSLVGGATVNFTFNKVAQSGEWILCEALVTNFTGLTVGVFPYIETSYSTGNIWIDDVRIQPYDAQAVCYVYDIDNLRLLTTFDDQHFGLFYQYNAEGQLVRKIIETERGMKTVQETQYNAPTVARP